MDPLLSDLEELLRRSRPRPRPAFVAELEATLLRSVRRAPRRRLRPRRLELPRLRVAVGFATAIASLLLVLSIAGLHPFGMGGTPGAKADRQCVTVDEWVLVREPTFVADRHGHVTVRYRSELVARPRIRCR